MSVPPSPFAGERVVYKTAFNPSYIRTRHNNVRCFPQCSDPHKGTSFCGRMVEASVFSSAHGAEEVRRGLFFGEFRKASDPASFRVGEPAQRSMLKDKAEQMVMGECVAWSEAEGFQFVFNPKKRWTCLGKIQDGEEFVFTSYLAIGGVVRFAVDSSPFLVIPVWKIEDRKRVRISQTALASSRPAKQAQAANEEDEDAGSGSSGGGGGGSGGSQSPGEDKPKPQSKVPFMSFVPTRSPPPPVAPSPPRLSSPAALTVPLDLSNRMRYPSPVHSATSRFAAFQPLGYSGSFHSYHSPPPPPPPPPLMNMYSQPPPQQAHFHPSLFQGHFPQLLVPPASPLSPVPPPFPFVQQLTIPQPQPPPLPLSPTYWHQPPSLMRLPSLQQHQAPPPATLPPSPPNSNNNNQ